MIRENKGFRYIKTYRNSFISFYPSGSYFLHTDPKVVNMYEDSKQTLILLIGIFQTLATLPRRFG